MFDVTANSRHRRLPFYDATVSAGVTGFSICNYNQMLIPTGFGDPEGEYWRLINGVAQWDVSCVRQVELRSPMPVA
ncbi:MAG: hypothetical protein OXC93_09875 [Rhodospirillaceae bacterium]|nr:hypothetical protein [Rhodospirillaceae bacterium]